MWATSVDADAVRPLMGAIWRFMASQSRSSTAASSWLSSSRDDMGLLLFILRYQNSAQAGDRSRLCGVDRRAASPQRLGNLVAIESCQPELDHMPLIRRQVIEERDDFQTGLLSGNERFGLERFVHRDECGVERGMDPGGPAGIDGGVVRDREEPRSEGFRLAVVDGLHGFEKDGARGIRRSIGVVQPACAVAIDALGIAAIEWLEGGKVLPCGQNVRSRRSAIGQTDLRLAFVYPAWHDLGQWQPAFVVRPASIRGYVSGDDWQDSILHPAPKGPPGYRLTSQESYGSHTTVSQPIQRAGAVSAG